MKYMQTRNVFSWKRTKMIESTIRYGLFAFLLPILPPPSQAPLGTGRSSTCSQGIKSALLLGRGGSGPPHPCFGRFVDLVEPKQFSKHFVLQVAGWSTLCIKSQLSLVPPESDIF